MRTKCANQIHKQSINLRSRNFSNARLSNRLGVAALLFVLCFILSVSIAGADQDINLKMFAPSIFGGDFIAIDDGDALKQFSFGFGLFYDYADSPFSYFEDDELVFDFISAIHSAHLSAAFAPFDWRCLGFQAPFHLSRSRTITGDEIDGERQELKDSGPVVGDMRLVMKFQALGQKRHWINLAMAPSLHVPTGNPDLFLGEGRWTGGGTLILEHDFGIINVGLNGGYLVRGAQNELLDAQTGDAILFGAGVSKTFDSGFGIGLEYFGRRYAVEDDERVYNVPMELLATLRYSFGKRKPRLVAGAGPGLSKGMGTPIYRIVGGIDYFYSPLEDGRLTVLTQDEAGQPLAANLGLRGTKIEREGIVSAGRYATPLRPGQYTVSATQAGYEPVFENVTIQDKGDHTLTLVLKALPKPKSFLTLTVVDKCTGKLLGARLRLSDGTVHEMTTGKMKVEIEPAVHQATVTVPGYESGELKLDLKPGEKAERKIGLYRQIPKDSRVHFSFDPSRISNEYFPMLDDIAVIAREICDFQIVIVEGHTDSVGPQSYNEKLSYRRANSVKVYLEGKGVPPAQIRIVSLGEIQPIANNTDRSGRAKNRRVELYISHSQ